MTSVTASIVIDADAWQDHALLLAAWAETHLVNRRDAWGQYLPLSERQKGSAKTAKGALELIRLKSHFEGTSIANIIGLHSTSQNDTCKWVAIDIDQHGDDIEQAMRNEICAREIFEEARSLGFRPLLEDSNGNGGYHLWIFFSEVIASDRAFRFGHYLARRCKGLGVEDFEVYPKQPRLDGEKQFGNWLRLPGRHHSNSHWSRFWDGNEWKEGRAAVDVMLSHNGDDPAKIPAKARAFKTPDVVEAEATKQRAAEYTRSSTSLDERQKRARAYLRTVPGAVSGQHGQDATYRAACVVVLDFDLSPAAAFPVLQEWNQKCEPPWTEKDLRKKLNDANNESGERGAKLRDDCSIGTNGNGHASTAAKPAESKRERKPKAKPAAPIPAWKPYPVDLWPYPVSEFIQQTAGALGCDPSLVAQPTIAALGAAIGTSRSIVLIPGELGWREFPIIWSAIVGESGDMKSPAIQHALHALMERQLAALDEHDERYAEYVRSHRDWDSRLAEWKKAGKKSLEEQPEEPQPPVACRHLVSDATIEAVAPILQGNPRGVLAYFDELANWFASHGRYSGGASKVNGDAAKYLEAWRGGPWVIDRRTGFPKNIRVPRAAISITGGIQPAILSMALGRERYQDGTAARFLLAMPPRRLKRWKIRPVPEGTYRAICGLCDSLLSLSFGVNGEGKEKPKPICLDDDGLKEWEVFYNRHNVEMEKMAGDLRYAWSKLEAYCARLALIIHLVRVAVDCRDVRDPDLVDAKSINAAAELVAWYGNEARRIYARMLDPEADRETQELVAFIRSNGGAVTTRDVMRGGPKYQTADEATQNLNELVRLEQAVRETIPTGGAPKTVWRLNEPAPPETDRTNDTSHQKPEENGFMSSVTNVTRGKSHPVGADIGEV